MATMLGLRPALALIVLAALLAGCSGGDEDAIAESELPRLVLQPSDLSTTWTRFDEGEQITADAPPGRRADPTRFGRRDGWKARYRRPGSRATPGPLVIDSRVDLFADAEGAKRDFEELEAELNASLGRTTRRLDAPEIGDEALAATASQGPVRYYSIAWRQQNVVAALLVNGFAVSLSFDHALRLARKQERRIEAAAG
jgi:hypothetical protein